MSKARPFTTIPARAIGDQRLSALDLRCIMVIALHDGMSLLRGTGAGCYAKHTTLAERLGVDVTSFSRTLSKVQRMGYVLREPQLTDKRRFTLRVIYGDDDTCPAGQLSGHDATPSERPEQVDNLVNYSAEIVDESDNGRPKVVDMGYAENGSFPKKNPPQYIPLNGEIHFDESNEIDSVETAQPAVAACEVNQLLRLASGNLRTHDGAYRGLKKNGAEALAFQGVNLADILPKNFGTLPVDAQLQRIEDGLRRIEWDVASIEPRASALLADLLYSIMDQHDPSPTGQRANRLFERFAEAAA